MKIFKGIAGADGIAKGKVCYFKKAADSLKKLSFEEAAAGALEKVKFLYKKTLDEMGEEKAKIFAAYEMLLEDNMLLAPIKAKIDAGEDKEKAIRSVTDMMADKLASKNNEYMRQRADDIRYIGNLLIDVLNGADDEFHFPKGDSKYIVAADELTPVDTMLFERSRLAGFITKSGGVTSHVIILAKSLGIPAVVGAKELEEFEGYENAYLDGYEGTLIVSPDDTTNKIYEQKINDELIFEKNLEKLKNSEARTKDGKKIAVCINIGKPSDMAGSENEKIDGVGLFRSEFLYSSLSEKPTFDEQVKAYKEVIQLAKPNSVTIRTLDAGGDKQIKYLGMKKEENPFLGSRGIRLCLNNILVFSEQIKAILVAAAGESVKIMLPMINSVDEIKKAKSVIENVKAELEGEGTPYCTNVLCGIMIETPASAITADIFAKHADFFSIGTNDLVQYINAADRGNADVKSLYNPCHPAVIRMIKNVISEAKKANIDVSVCGDLAANERFTKLLLGLGLEKFSVPLPMAGRIKHKISQTDLESAKEFAKKVLGAQDEHEIENMLKG